MGPLPATKQPPTTPRELGTKTNKSCDSCRNRKVKCPNPGNQGPCRNCIRRKTECTFGARKPSRRRNAATQFLAPKQSPSADGPTGVADTPINNPAQQQTPAEVSLTEAEKASAESGWQHQIPDLYVDQLLSRSQNLGSAGSKDQPFLRINGLFGGSFGLTFFSDARLASLSNRLGNNKVNDLVGRISHIIRGRLTKRPESGPNPTLLYSQRNQNTNVFTDKAAAAKYIELYFERIHPIFPFLDRMMFEKTAFSNDLETTLANNKQWMCLYHSTLALGSQLDDGGSFEPGAGKSWKIFSVALSNFPDLLLQPDSLATLQAVTSMAVFALGASCLAVEQVITSEAARRAQNLSTVTYTGRTAQMYQRAFWTVYAIEKMSAFNVGRTSVFVDADISCPIPRLPEAIFSGLDWFWTLLAFARIVSRALTNLFSVGVVNKPSGYYLQITGQLKGELEAWRMSLPDNGFRPMGSVRPESIGGGIQRQVVIFLHYLHAHLILVMSLANLHHLSRSSDPSIQLQRQSAGNTILETSRRILELTTLINVEPHTNIWLLATIPLTGLFVLFDIVVHNPLQPEAVSNLALLDMAAGHFSRIEYLSKGSLPGSLISEFAHIARDHVSRVQHGDTIHRPQDQQQQHQQMSQQSTDSVPPLQQRITTAESLKSSATSVGLEGAPYAYNQNQASCDPPMSQTMVLDYPVDAFERHLLSDASMGTNVMDLFSNFLPNLDPMFYSGMPGTLDFDPTFGGEEN